MTEVSNGRRTALVGLILLFLYSLFPYAEVYAQFSSEVESAFTYLKLLLAGGSAITPTNSMF